MIIEWLFFAAGVVFGTWGVLMAMEVADDYSP